MGQLLSVLIKLALPPPTVKGTHRAELSECAHTAKREGDERREKAHQIFSEEVENETAFEDMPVMNHSYAECHPVWGKITRWGQYVTPNWIKNAGHDFHTELETLSDQPGEGMVAFAAKPK